MSDCGCDYETGECQAPLGCKAVAEIVRLRSSEECLRLAVAALVKNETELKAEIERLRAERDEWKQAAGVEAGLRREFLAEVERLRGLLANSEMTVKELLANDERLTAALQRIISRNNLEVEHYNRDIDVLARAALEGKPE